MDNNKTLTNLYSKTRNRFAKVLYILLYSILILSFVYNGFDDFSYSDYFYIKAIVVTIIIFELIKRAYYYIALGTLQPKK
jgi:hypothetical protein